MKESHIKQDAKVFGNKVANAAKKVSSWFFIP